MRKYLSYTSAESLLVIGRILECLMDGPADTKQIIAATHRTGPRARGYINHLAETGKIFCIEPQAGANGKGSTPSVWALEPTPFEHTPDEDDQVDLHARRVIVRDSWPPHHVRSPMDCLLFGVPAAMERRAA